MRQVEAGRADQLPKTPRVRRRVVAKRRVHSITADALQMVPHQVRYAVLLGDGKCLDATELAQQRNARGRILARQPGLTAVEAQRRHVEHAAQ